MSQVSKDWCEEFFDDLFAEHHLVREDGKEMQETVAFLTEKLHLKPQDKIFDQCCGVGSLAIPLAKRDYRVTGVDLIPSYIDRAKRDAGAVGKNCLFEAGDAYTYVAPEPCDAAVNWWTSFGYMSDNAQNIKMLQCVAKSLRNGAWLALDYMNSPQRRAQFSNRKKSSTEIVKKDCTIIWESEIDVTRDMVVKKWVYKGLDGKVIEKQGGGAKLYSSTDLEKMFTACGFVDIAFYGSVAGEPRTDISPRCIVVARKGG